MDAKVWVVMTKDYLLDNLRIKNSNIKIVKHEFVGLTALEFSEILFEWKPTKDSFWDLYQDIEKKLKVKNK